MTFLRSSLQAFHEGITQRQLQGVRCRTCGALFAPPRPLCVHCRVDAMEPVVLSGRGELTAFSSMNIAPPWMSNLGYDRTNPYISCVVKLEEGPSIVGRLITGELSLDEVRIGLPVEVDFDAPLTRPCVVFRVVAE